MPRFKKKTTLTSTRSADACLFCNSEEDNVEVFGKMLKKQGITVHYFCMLFSSGLWQRGKRERDGILGFMPADIYREQKRGNRLTCQYCRKKGATIGCVISNCRKTFHFRCGREAGGMSQFFQQFRSYCPDHRPCQETHTSDRLAFYGTAKSTCSICMLSVEARASNDTLRSPCCRKAWFHRNCIQRYAHSAGAYFFKCPLCNNKELFEAEMLEFGIYIPEQDAAWEQDPSAFQELLERYNRCDTHHCLCPDGREHDGPPGSRWEIHLCDWCGSSGTHISCHGFTRLGKEDLCKECAEFNIIMAENKVTRNSSAPPKAVSNEQEVRRRLDHRLAASLRAERAARRQGTSPSSDAPQKIKSAHGGRRARIREKRVDRAVVPSAGSGESTAVSAAKLLKDHRLTRSTPIVYIERAESESEVGIVDVEETSDTSANQMAPLGCRGSHGPLEPSLVSSPAHLGRNEPGGSSALEQDRQEAEMTHTLLENTETAQSSSENAQGADDSQEANPACWHDIPAVCREGESPEHSAASSWESLPADIKQASLECAWSPQSTFLSPGDLSHAEEMPQEMMGIKDPQKLSLPMSSQTDHNGATFAQTVPSYLPHSSSPLRNGSDAVINELELSGQNMDTSATSRHTARSESSKKEGQRRGKASVQKRGHGRPVKIHRCPSLLWQNLSIANFMNIEMVNDENTSQRVTRSQSFTNKRLTRSASAHPQLLKRSYSSSGLPLERRSAKRCKTPRRHSSTKMRTGENGLIDRCLQQQQNKSFSMGSAGRRERPRRVRFCEEPMDVRILSVTNNDGNNDMSDDRPGLEVSPQHSHSCSPRRLERTTQSAQHPDLHPNPKTTLDCIKKRKRLLSNGGDSLQNLPSQDSKDSLTTDKTLVRKKGKEHSDIQPVGLNSSTPDSQTLTQEQRAGDDGPSEEGYAYSIASASQQHPAPWLSASTSTAFLPRAQPMAPGRFTPQSFVHRMTAFQAGYFTLSSLDRPHALSWSNSPQQEHPGQVLLWNLQFQRRATTAVVFHCQPTVALGFDSPSSDGGDWFFPGFRQAVDVPLKPRWSPALPQPISVDPDPRGVWLVEQQCQPPRSFFARPKLTAPLLSFLGSNTDAWASPDEVSVTREELDGLSNSLQLYPMAITHATSQPSAVLCNPFEGMMTSAVAGQLQLALLGRDSGSVACVPAGPGILQC